MIDREQVWHVARLARLRLTEEEVERMTGELGEILQHVEAIQALDLDDVEPTTHVAPLENVLRPDEPRESWPRERRAGGRADASDEGFRVPSPAGRSTSPPHRPRSRSARASSPAEMFEAYRERAAADELNAFLWVADSAPEPDPQAPLAGIPVAIKDLFCVEGVPERGGVAHPRGPPPWAYTATSVRKLAEAGAPMLGKTNMDEFAMGSSNENSGFGPVKNPWDPSACPAARAAGFGRGGGRGPGAVGDRHRHRRLDPPARLAVRAHRAQADLRRGLALRDDRLRVLPDQAGPLARDVKDAALLSPAHGRPRPPVTPPRWTSPAS